MTTSLLVYWLVWSNRPNAAYAVGLLSSSSSSSSGISIVDSTPSHMVVANGFICGIYIGILPSLMRIELFAHVT